jgi:hypothetical protein
MNPTLNHRKTATRPFVLYPDLFLDQMCFYIGESGQAGFRARSVAGMKAHEQQRIAMVADATSGGDDGDE